MTRSAACAAWLTLVALLALVGCGEVTQTDLVAAADAGAELAGDGGAPDGAAETHTVGSPDAVDHDTVSTSETSPPPSCIAAGCAACTLAMPAGPGYPSAAVCEAVIACVRAGVLGYGVQWETCDNMFAVSQDVGGLLCAQNLNLACP